MAKKRKSAAGPSQGGRSTKEAKKRSRDKSKKHALRSATYAVKKLIDSALADGQPRAAGADAEALLRRKKKSIRRAAAATARLVEAAVAEDVEGRRRRSHETTTDIHPGNLEQDDESDSDRSDDPRGAAAALAPFVGRGLEGMIDDSLRTTRDEATTMAMLEGASMAVDDDEEGTAPTYLEDAFVQSGGEYFDESTERWAEFWASSPTVVGVDAEGTHFSPPLLVQIAADSMRGRVLLCAPGNALSSDLARLMGDASIRKVFFGDPRRERIGCVIRNGVDTQVAERAISQIEQDAPQRGLADVCGRLLQGAPYAKRKRLQKSFGFYRQRADQSLRHSRHWLSTAQRKYAAADAWATLALYTTLDENGAAFEIHDVAAEAPSPAHQRGRPTLQPPSRADDMRAFVNRSFAPASPSGTHTRFGE